MLRMMLAAALCLVAIPLAGCVTSPDAPRSAVDRALDANATIRTRTEIALPFLPMSIARRVEAGLILADTAAAIAQRDATPAERTLALQQLTGQVAAIVSNLRHSKAAAAP
jgi:hypothetical protein